MMKHPFLDLGKVNAPYRADIEQAIKRVLDSGYYVGGPEVENFEQELAAYTGTRHAVAMSNGLDALRLALRAYIELGKLKPGDEVIVPANTYVATVLAITDNGLTPVLVEPSPVTLNLDTDRIRAALSDRTRAIMPVHLYGRVCWDETMEQLARELIVIEDNAQAIGATWRGRRTGSLGSAAAFSFYPTKNLGALGDAGAVTTDDDEVAAVVRALRNYGSDRKYHNIYAGANCRMDPVQAAILQAKFPHLDASNAARRAKAELYSELIESSFITTPYIPVDPKEHVWHQYVIAANHRDALKQYLAENGVGADIHYATPPHLQPCYADLKHGSLPITEALANRVLSLPIADDTTTDDVCDICEIINCFKV